MDTLLTPLYFLVSWIMIGWHWVFADLLGIPNDGVNWALSIIGLVVVIRIMLIPLFVRQIKAQRNMQMLQPKVREIQKKYKGDRERLQQETMKLYKETGTNPFASCMPIILQAPFLFALFRVLDGIAKDIPRGAFVSHPELFESAGGSDDLRSSAVGLVPGCAEHPDQDHRNGDGRPDDADDLPHPAPDHA